ncbi:hypothetical protein CAPTEDRAFT_75410, partial [Capitella teleta]
VPDSRMTASSEHCQYHGAERARIDFRKTGNYDTWCPSNSDPSEWIQVEFDDLMTVQTVTTTGSLTFTEWIPSYEIHTSLDGVTWTTYMEPFGTTKVLTGNDDPDTPVENVLNTPIRAKYFRLANMTWQKRIAVCLELQG